MARATLLNSVNGLRLSSFGDDGCAAFARFSMVCRLLGIGGSRGASHFPTYERRCAMTVAASRLDRHATYVVATAVGAAPPAEADRRSVRQPRRTNGSPRPCPSPGAHAPTTVDRGGFGTDSSC
jgi:hypothetical protein